MAFTGLGVNWVGCWILVPGGPVGRPDTDLFRMEEAGLLGNEEVRTGADGLEGFSGIGLEFALCNAGTLSFCSLEPWEPEFTG